MVYSNGPSIVRDGLVLHLDAADRNSYSGSGSTWYDLSGNGNNGTFGAGTSAPTFSSSNRGCIVFDGNNDYGETGQSNDLLLGTDDFTIEAFVFFNTLNSSTTILRTDSGNVYNGVLFGHQTKLDCLITSNGTSWNVVSQSFVASGALSNTWYHLVLTRIGNNFSGYTNGSLVWTVNATGTPSIYQSNSIMRFGAANSNGAYPMNGRISNIRIYKTKGLNIEQIRQNYNATKGRFGL